MAAAWIADDGFAGGDARPAGYRSCRSLPDRELSAEDQRDLYLNHLFLPWYRRGGELFVACAEADDGTRAAAARAFGRGVRLLPVGKQALVDALQERFRASLAHDAEFRLDETRPMLSARHIVSPGQRWGAFAIIAAVGAATLIVPELVQTAGFAALAVLYSVNIAVRLLLFACGWNAPSVHRVDPAKLSEASDIDFPLYTVLVPLYREANMMGRIVRALEHIDYPRLDIKLILEEGDGETIAAARAFRLDDRFEILIVPDSRLRTKPRACNYGLSFARGEFVVIFDAEDRPEPDQLKKSALAFHAAPGIACLQARLAFYNAKTCWLTRMFALEYGAWFSIMLPGLARLGVPIPLGGTSNHFRASVLRAVGGWDAYNVTEDADLGLRLARAGYRVAPLDSVTLEEATTGLGNWVRQRSRWLKGHMQTALVHMREPRRFAHAVGWVRYGGCLLFIGGAVVNTLVSPIMWLFAALWWATGTGPSDALYDALFLASLTLGNGVLTALAVLAAGRTGQRDLAAWGLTAGAYWLLMSAGAYKGLAQLLNGRSAFWEKTIHGRTPGREWHIPLWPLPRPAFAHVALGLALVVLTACAALANPWTRSAGQGEVVGTVRMMRSDDGFAAGASDDTAFDLRGEVGATDAVTLILNTEVKADDIASGARLELAQAGARVALVRWDGGVFSIEGLAGVGAVRAAGGNPFFASLHTAGEARALIGQDFTLWGSHAWLAFEGGWRWRGGPPADEAITDVTLGVQPRDDLFFMLQSFGTISANDATDGYRPYNSNKAQLSAVYEFAPGLWVQVGGIASVAGDDSGAAGGVAALWWRF